MSMPDSGVYAQSNSRRKIAARQDPKSAFPKRRKTDLSVDEDADDYAPTPKPKPVTTARPAWPVDEDEADDAGTDTAAPEGPKGPSAAGLSALAKLPVSDKHKAKVIDAYTRVGASGTSWQFVLRRDTDRTVLALREVMRAELDEAVAAAKESPTEDVTRRRYLASARWDQWVEYALDTHKGRGRRRHLKGKTLADFDPADPKLDRKEKRVAKVVIPDDDPTPHHTEDQEQEQDEGVDDRDEVTEEARKSGRPATLAPDAVKRTASGKGSERAAKKVDVSKLPELKPVRSRQFRVVFTKKWTGRGGYTAEWVYSVLEAVTPVGERSLSPMQQLLGQMSYWEQPMSTGEPRKPAEHRTTIDGVEWFETSISKLAKFFRWPTRMVGTALDRLVDVGLVGRMVTVGKFGPYTSYTRIKWEVVHHLLAVEKVMTPHEVRQPKAEEPESKRSKKGG